MPEHKPEPQYTIVHPDTHRQYHTDLRTATELHALRERRLQPTYRHAFDTARADGRIHDGEAPRHEHGVEPHAPGGTRVSVDVNGAAPHVEYVRQFARDRGAEPSVTD